MSPEVWSQVHDAEEWGVWNDGGSLTVGLQRYQARLTLQDVQLKLVLKPAHQQQQK